MMAASRWGGRTAARFSRFILDRDGHRCRMMRDGVECGAFATTVQHDPPLSAGGPRYDPATACAACGPCNYREGGRLARPQTRPAPDRLTPRQALAVARLDAAGVPFDAGRRVAHAALRGRRPWLGAEDLDAVTSWRRARGPISAGPATPSRRW